MLQLAIMAIAIAVLLQIIKPEDALKRIGGLIAAFVLLSCFVGMAHAVWLAMSMWQRALVILLGILFALGAFQKPTSGRSPRN